MANPVAKTLLSLAAVCAAVSGLSAQNDQVNQLFEEAVRKIRTNQPDEGLAKLRELLALDPSNRDAFELWKRTDTQVMEMLLAEGGEYEQIARLLLSRAKLDRVEQSRDADEISTLVQGVLSADRPESAKARAELASKHGEFAVPALLAVLADSDQDDGHVNAMLSLFQIGRPAVMPLIAALNSSNELMRRNAASALVQIGDARSAGALAGLVNDESEAVRYVAQQGLDAMGVAAGTSAVDLNLLSAKALLSAGGVGDGDHSNVVWSWNDGSGLVATDVPAIAYHTELAKMYSQAALRAEPSNSEAQSLLARAYLSQIAAIEGSLAVDAENEAIAAAAERLPALRMVAAASGPTVLRRALSDALSENSVQVAVGAIRALGGAEDRATLDSSPLTSALSYEPSARVRYAAALALVEASGGSQTPMASEVVAVLGQAVQEEAQRSVYVIDGAPGVQMAVNAASKTRGYIVDASATGQEGVNDFLRFPNFDVVVIGETLSDSLPDPVISLIRDRNPNTKIVMHNFSEEAEERYGDKVDGFVSGELTVESLIAKVNELIDESGLDAGRKAATDIAISAGNALAVLGGNDVDLGGALNQLADQLDRDDAVAIPAAHALAQGGSISAVPSLLTALKGDGSVELKAASASAVGSILGRADSIDGGTFEELLAMAANGDLDQGVRQAVVGALGKAKLSPGERLKLTESLSTIAGGSASADGE